MERIAIDARPNWPQEVEKLGYGFFEPAGTPGWTEEAYFRLDPNEFRILEETAERVHRMCMSALKKVVDERLYPLFGIDVGIGKMITESWERNDPSICGRMNFVWNGDDPPQMFSYDADNPSGLFETAVMQPDWRAAHRFPEPRQSDHLHDKLVARWRQLAKGRYNLAATPLYLTVMTPNTPEEHSLHFMGIAAQQGGWSAQYIPLQDIGWNGTYFTDAEEKEISWVLKRHPWNEIVETSFGPNIPVSGSIWIEPLWRMILENKAFLTLLTEMYPEHPNLLPTYSSNRFTTISEQYVVKPTFGRGGQNISVYEISDNRGPRSLVLEETRGDCGSGDFVYQSFVKPPSYDGNYPHFGVWMVADEACGLSVHESRTLIASDAAHFVPHIIE